MDFQVESGFQIDVQSHHLYEWRTCFPSIAGGCEDREPRNTLKECRPIRLITNK